MIAHTKRLFWLCYWVAVALLGLTALLVVVLRLAYPQLPAYQQTIETRLSEIVGAEVSFGQMRTYWRGQNPVLELDAVNVEGDTAVRVDKAVIALDLPRSLAYQQLVFTQLELEQPDIRVRAALPAPAQEAVNDPASRPFDPEQAEGAALLKLLLRQERISINNASLDLQLGGLPAIQVGSLSANLRSSGAMHQLKIDGAMVNGEQRAPFRFTAEVEGSVRSQPLNFYFDLPKISQDVVNPWLAHAKLEPLESLDAHLRLWGAYQRRALNYLYLDTGIASLKAAEQTLADVDLNLTLQQAKSGYQGQLSGELIANDKPYQLPLLAATWGEGLGVMPDSLTMDSLDLQKLMSWLDGQPFLPGMGQRAVTMLKPEGYIENLQIRWQTPEWESFVANADLINVSVSPWGGAPGLRYITGRLRHDISGGSIDLDNNRFAMSFPDLKMPEWQYSFARGHVNWSLSDTAVEVGSGLLQLKNKDVTASGRFFFRMPYDKDGQTDLTLLIGVRDSLGTAFKEYIPPKEVGLKTHKWLMGAIQGGTVRSGGFMLNANTRSRLPDYQKPVVQLFLNVDDLKFGFDPDWPSVTSGQGHFLYRDFGFLAEAKGKLFDSTVKEAWVYSAPGATRLQILGNAIGDARDIRRTLMDTPIRSEVGEELPRWEWSAHADTTIDVDIALDRSRSPRVVASTRLKNGRFVSVEDRLSFENLAGRLSFTTAKGLQSDKLAGTLFGQPVSATIKSAPDEQSGQVTKVALKGKANMRQIEEWLNQPYLAVAEGITDYTADLELCTANPFCSFLKIRSNLQGVSIAAPAPLGKEADQKRHFDMMYALGDPKRQKLWLNYNGDLRAVFQLAKDRVESGRVVIGGKEAKLPVNPGLWIEGQLARLDVAELRAFLTKAGFVQADQQAVAAQETSDIADDFSLQDIRMQIGELTSGGLVLQNLSSEIRKVKDGWRVSGENPMLKGVLFLPDDKKRVASLNLDYLKIQKGQFDTSGEKAESDVTEDKGFNASELPLIDLAVKSVTVNDKPYGAWMLEMRPDATGATFQNVKGDLFGVQVAGDARWATAGIEHSVMLMRFQGEDLNPLFSAWGYDRFIETKYLEANANMIWLGTPWEFGVDKLNGHVEMLAKNGRIIQAGESGQFLRVLGILNLETVGRRLRLDFSDLFAEGLAFDRLSADYDLRNGVAISRKPFSLEGPSANMTLSGSLDLVNETVDKDMEVVLPVTKNLPVMSVLLGQPQVAGAVFLIDKLIGDKLEKFTTIKYHLSGDWSDPQLALEQQAKSDDLRQNEDPLFRGDN
ncbi:YhdP family protein [Pontibacterium sp.]|uniref:YhdP family protein n=1 Tax=Pontibacterium sp. TaxID=2036026 RepID=UPI0035132F28